MGPGPFEMRRTRMEETPAPLKIKGLRHPRASSVGTGVLRQQWYAPVAWSPASKIERRNPMRYPPFILIFAQCLFNCANKHARVKKVAGIGPS